MSAPSGAGSGSARDPMEIRLQPLETTTQLDILSKIQDLYNSPDLKLVAKDLPRLSKKMSILVHFLSKNNSSETDATEQFSRERFYIMDTLNQTEEMKEDKKFVIITLLSILSALLNQKNLNAINSSKGDFSNGNLESGDGKMSYCKRTLSSNSQELHKQFLDHFNTIDVEFEDNVSVLEFLHKVLAEHGLERKILKLCTQAAIAPPTEQIIEVLKSMYLPIDVSWTIQIVIDVPVNPQDLSPAGVTVIHRRAQRFNNLKAQKCFEVDMKFEIQLNQELNKVEGVSTSLSNIKFEPTFPVEEQINLANIFKEHFDI